jgi:hypothetical protein
MNLRLPQKEREFLSYLRNHQLLKNPAAWSYIFVDVQMFFYNMRWLSHADWCCVPTSVRQIGKNMVRERHDPFLCTVLNNSLAVAGLRKATKLFTPQETLDSFTLGPGSCYWRFGQSGVLPSYNDCYAGLPICRHAVRNKRRKIISRSYLFCSSARLSISDLCQYLNRWSGIFF